VEGVSDCSVVLTSWTDDVGTGSMDMSFDVDASIPIDSKVLDSDNKVLT